MFKIWVTVLGFVWLTTLLSLLVRALAPLLNRHSVQQFSYNSLSILVIHSNCFNFTAYISSQKKIKLLMMPLVLVSWKHCGIDDVCHCLNWNARNNVSLFNALYRLLNYALLVDCIIRVYHYSTINILYIINICIMKVLNVPTFLIEIWKYT